MLTLLKWGLVLVGLFFLMRACSEVIDPANVQSDPHGSWTTLESLNGSSDMVTQTYTSPPGKARVRWQVNNTVGRVGLFKVSVKRPDGTVLKNISDISVGAGDRRSGDRSFIDAHSFYLEIQATVPWEITVEAIE